MELPAPGQAVKQTVAITARVFFVAGLAGFSLSPVTMAVTAGAALLGAARVERFVEDLHDDARSAAVREDGPETDGVLLHGPIFVMDSTHFYDPDARDLETADLLSVSAPVETEASPEMAGATVDFDDSL